ncbi:MAG: enolase C-terminal domain-like protein [Burkholderiaceae bacterium]
MAQRDEPRPPGNSPASAADRPDRGARAALAGAAVMADANQAWDLASAIRMAQRLAPSEPGWLEEPLRADAPWSDWQQLAAAAPVPLAAGENTLGEAGFDALIASRAIAVVQPDLAKWGGLSGVARVVDRIHAAGLRYCPHYLGAGIGLLASAHLLAARGTPSGWLEVDANENPLRNLLCPPLAALSEGRMTLPSGPGLGIEPDLPALRSACVSRAG